MKKIYKNTILILGVLAILVGLIYLFIENYIQTNSFNEVTKSIPSASTTSAAVFAKNKETIENNQVSNSTEATSSVSDPFAKYTNVFEGRIIKQLFWTDGTLPGTGLMYGVSVLKNDKGTTTDVVRVNEFPDSSSSPAFELSSSSVYKFAGRLDAANPWYDVTPESITEISENASGAGSQ